MRPQATALYALLAGAIGGHALAAEPPSVTASPHPLIEGQFDPALAAALSRALNGLGGASPSRFEARRRAVQAGEAAIAVLRSEGYYAQQVEADVVDAADGSNQPVVRVTAGPQFKIAGPKVVWAGPEPDPDSRAAATAAMALADGSAGRAADVLAAEGRIVASIEQHGYADAAAQAREVVADFADNTLQPTFNIASGPKVRLGGVRVTTRGRSNPVWIAGLAPWSNGDLYTPDRLAELERRLRDTGVYDQVSVALEPAAANGTEPRAVLVNLADRAARTIELGAGYSTSEGGGLDAKFIRYNRLRRADTTTFTARLAQIEQKLDGEVALPQWRGPQQTLKAGVAVYRENTDAFDETGVGGRLDLTRRYGRTSFRTFGASLDLTQTKQKISTATGVTEGDAKALATFAGLAAFSLDRSDDPLNPRRGWRLEGRTEPTFITGQASISFLKTQAQASGYWPVDAQADTVVAGRLKLGVIAGGSLDGVPASRRFFSGGGGSVRGYAFQAIGPRFSDNTPQGGVSLAETSVEVRRRVSAKWSVVGFVDVGAVGGEGFPAGDAFSAGAGLGVRYDLGFGPIRADIAAPLDRRTGDPAFQIYISIGQSF